MIPRPHVPAGLALLALAPAAATAAVYLPQLLTDSDEFGAVPATLRWAWLALLLAAAPLVAAVVNRRLRLAVPLPRAVAVGLPQLLVAIALVRLDVWLEVRSGYLLAGSGEEAMSYGLGTVAAVVVGTVLALLVPLGAAAGRRIATRRGSADAAGSGPSPSPGSAPTRRARPARTAR